MKKINLVLCSLTTLIFIACGGPDTSSTPNKPTCDDGIENGDETGIDCGGSCFVNCNGSVNTERCEDGVQNGDEEDIDCGGTCPNDCVSREPSCFDRIQNGDEEDVDCGGSCLLACDAQPVATCFDGLQNGSEEGIDCGGGCSDCPTCTDGIRNGTEEGIDCGGSCEMDCPEPSCFDGVQNQNEVGIDCGGPCDDCVADPTCTDGILNQGEEQVDCGGPCDACPEPTCDDNIQNQDETGVDCGGSCLACPEPATPGDIVITEIMYNPDCVGDTNGEWVEIQNRTNATIDMRGWVFSDDDGTSGRLDGVVLSAGARAVLCKNQNTTVNGGVTCDLQIDIGFANGSDLVYVLDATGQTIDSVRWFSTFPDEEGHSIAIDDETDHIENDEGENWFLSEGRVSDTCEDGGTPGLPNVRTVEPDPTCDDGILNQDEVETDCGGSVCEPCQVLPTCNDGEQNGDEEGTDCGGSQCEACIVPPTCDDGEQNGDETGIDCGGSTCAACNAPGDVGSVVFTEVMYNPSCVGDSSGEWFEIKNVSGGTLDITGWTLIDDDNTGGTLETTVLMAGEVLVVCKNNDVATNGGIQCDAELPMSLGNSGDTLLIKDVSGTTIDTINYGLFPDANGESVEGLSDSHIDNDLSDNWVVATAAISGGCGDLGTPGI